MSPTQLKQLRELSLLFRQGKATPKQLQQLSTLLTQKADHSNKAKARNQHCWA